MRKEPIEKQLEYQKRLNSITNSIHSTQDTNDILLNLQKEILGLFNADRITIYTIDDKKKELVSRVKTGNEINKIAVPIDYHSIAGFCAKTGKAVNIFDVYDQDELKRVNPQLKFNKTWDQKTGYRTTRLLVSPIIYNTHVLGVIQLINKSDGKRFTKLDQSSVLDIAKVLGIAFFKNNEVAEKIKPTRYDFLITNNIISSKDLAEAMSRARKIKRSVESLLMNDFYVSKEDIGRSLSDYYNTRFIAYDDKIVIPDHLLKGLKKSYLKKNTFVPVAQSGDKVLVAMEDPRHLPARDEIKRLVSAKKFEYCVSLKEDIYKMIDLFFSAKRTGMLKDSKSIEDMLQKLDAVDDEYEEMEYMAENDSVIVRLVNKIIIDAYHRGTSDIHIEPGQGKDNSVIRFRVDGDCHVYQTIPHTYQRAIVSRLKIMSDLDIAEKRLPQDGKIKFRKFVPQDIELRLATIPTVGKNEDVVMRILASGGPIALDRMGMSRRDYGAFTDMIKAPYGMVLVVGPSGSGKTTTLHSALGLINKPEIKIWTAEDPVEITQEGLRQVQVLPKIGFDFATAMRSFLRADPDVIMVGEMRDSETVSTGIEASLTGHLVFSTLHTNSAPETITRLLDMGMDSFNFADAILGVLGQRLVRTLCKDCKEKYHPSGDEFDALVRTYDGDFDAMGFEYNNLFLFRPKGCSKCGDTGYRGRTAIFELLLGTYEIKSLIQKHSTTNTLKKQAVSDGTTSLMQDGIRKVCLGYTDLMQVRRVCIK